MATEWSVFIKHLGSEPLEDADAFDAFIELLTDYHGGAGVSADRTSYEVALTVEADDPGEAVHWANQLVYKSALNANVPHWPVVEAHAIRADELDRQLETPNFPDLVGVSEIAELLGVSRQRASRVTMRDDFPVPVAELAGGPVWTRPSISRFVEQWARKPGRPAKADA